MSKLRIIKCWLGYHLSKDLEISTFQVISDPELNYQCKYCKRIIR